MAPEIILNNNAAAMEAHPFACDAFSYGILAWQVLSGKGPRGRGLGMMGVLKGAVSGASPEIPAQGGWQVRSNAS
jgi:hypothetical protein